MIKGILFDKDGTLIDFSTLWFDATKQLIDQLFTEFDIVKGKTKEDLLHAIGFEKNGIRDRSPVASGTSKDIYSQLSRHYVRSKEFSLEFVQTFYYDYVVAHSDKIVPIGDLQGMLQSLKKKGFVLGVVTADDFDVTHFTFEHLGILHYFDFIGTADRYRKKPNGEALQTFCQQCSLEKQEVIHIGDSVVDMQFAEHCFSSVGVLSGVGNELALRKYTQHVYPSVHEIPFEEVTNVTGIEGQAKTSMTST